MLVQTPTWPRASFHRAFAAMAFRRALVAGSSAASRDPRPLEPFEFRWGLLGGGVAPFVVVVVFAAIADCTTDCIWFVLDPFEGSDELGGPLVEEPEPPWRTLSDFASTTA
uniref:Uncharacterized protein n=1 Tax=Arundo donax TaxID=35708 RepID=A0A0A9E5R7_ARUDO